MGRDWKTEPVGRAGRNELGGRALGIGQMRLADLFTAAEAMNTLGLIPGGVDAVLVDLGLPDRRGDELVREIRITLPLFAGRICNRRKSDRPSVAVPRRTKNRVCDETLHRRFAHERAFVGGHANGQSHRLIRLVTALFLLVWFGGGLELMQLQ